MLTNSGLKHAAINPFKLLAFLMLLTNHLQAQQKNPEKTQTHFGVGLELARPVGAISKNWKFGLGGSFLFEARFPSPAAFTASLSYVKFEEHWGGRYNGSHIDQLALLFGGRYYFAKYFFASGQLGYNVHQDDYGEFGGSVMVAPGAGFRYGKLDITAKYAIASRDYRDLSYLGLRVGVAF